MPPAPTAPKFKLNKKAPNVPTDPRALRRLERHIELGELEELLPTAGIPSTPRSW
jgi:hypothetical protein